MEDTKLAETSIEKLSEDGLSVDWHFQNLVDLVNRGLFEFGVTLFVNGQTITGRLISGKKYFDVFSSEFSRAWEGEDRDVIRKAMGDKMAMYDVDENGKGPELAQYVHIENAVVLTGGDRVPLNGGFLWRGKIKSVSGFALGQVERNS